MTSSIPTLLILMGVCTGKCISDSNSKRDTLKIKKGVLYNEYAKHIHPLDVIMFRGGDFISDLIRFLEKSHLRKDSSAGYNIPANAFSHIGIIVTTDILNDDRLEKGKLYIWESTMSGYLTDGIYNIDGGSFLGVQLRDFDEVFRSYDADLTTRIAVAHLKNNVFKKKKFQQNLKKKFTKLFAKYDGARYDANIFSLGSSLYSNLRPIRNSVERIFNTENWLFCSELVAMVFKELGFFSPNTEPKNVVPMDFLGYEADSIENGGIPVIVEEPVYIVSKKWWNDTFSPLEE